MCDFLRVIAWFCDEKFSLKKSCFYLYIRRGYVYCWSKTTDGKVPRYLINSRQYEENKIMVYSEEIRGLTVYMRSTMPEEAEATYNMRIDKHSYIDIERDYLEDY